MKKTTILVLVGLFASALLLAQAAGSIAAKVLSVQGRVEVEQSPWAPAKVDQILYAGNRIRTGPRSRAALLLADETQMKLASNTELELRAVRPSSNLLVRVAQTGARADQSILNMRRGRAWLRSKKKPAAVRVRTPAVTAAIRGTEFDIQVADDGLTTTTVVEGAVRFYNDLGSVVVNPGERGTCRVGEAPTKTVILNPKDAVQWTLFYSAAVSTRDFPFLYGSREQASASMGGGGDPVRQARIEHDAGELDRALATLRGVDSPQASETRGWILLEQNKIKEALDELEKAPSTSPRTRLGLSLAHYRVNELAESYRYVEDPGDDAYLKIQKAMLLLLGGDAQQARALLDSIAAADPAYSRGQGLLSNVLLAQNKKEDALQAARRAVQAAPESPSAYLDLSRVQQSFFDLPAATRSAEKALELDPNFIQARVQYARLLFGAGKTGRAEQVIRRALQVAPQEATLHSTLGFVLLSQGKTEEARVELERSIRMDNTRGEPHLGLGIADMRQGRRADAVLEMLQAATLEPQLSLYQSYLAKAFYEERKFEQAFAALAAAKELDPRDPTPHLYSGIFEEELNRPGVAVEDFRESVRLNDNRAVYRSRFVLDEDRATRNIKLATAYNRLGLTEEANLEAIKSYASDPTNSSTHIFLADTFLNLDGRTTAGGSELLMARLLLPVNTNSFNSFNDYTTLFERPRVNTTTGSAVGEQGFDSQTLIASGGARRLSFGSIFTRERGEGFRPTNDDFFNFTSVNLFKFAPTPHSDFLFSFSHTQTREGDRGQGSFLVSPNNDPDRRIATRVNRAEIGYHHEFHPGSELLLFFSGRTVDQVLEEPTFLKRFGIDFGLRRSSLQPNISLQAVHLLKVDKFQFKYGFDIFEGRSRTLDVLSFEFPSDPPELIRDEINLERQKIRFKTFFFHGDYIFSPKLIFTSGINYDWASDDNIFDDVEHSVGRWNPQAGFLLMPAENTTFRFGYMRTTQTHTQERLVPTHLYGFIINPNDTQLAQTNAFHAGWDQRFFGGRTFLRTTLFFRNRDIPTVRNKQPVKLNGDFYGGRLVLEQRLGEQVTFTSDYSVTHDINLFGLRHDHDLKLSAFWVHPSGVFIKAEEAYLNQSGLLGNAPQKTKVWTTNASISWELPQKTGLATLSINNIFNRKYTFLADPLALDPRRPRRLLKFELNFFF